MGWVDPLTIRPPPLQYTQQEEEVKGEKQPPGVTSQGEGDQVTAPEGCRGVVKGVQIRRRSRLGFVGWATSLSSLRP